MIGKNISDKSCLIHKDTLYNKYKGTLYNIKILEIIVNFNFLNRII